MHFVEDVIEDETNDRRCLECGGSISEHELRVHPETEICDHCRTNVKKVVHRSPTSKKDSRSNKHR